jgi:hypothetical protein
MSVVAVTAGFAVALSGCSADASDPVTPKVTDTRPATTDTPADKPLLMDQNPEQEPASFEGRTHVLNVTLRDLEGYAYIKDSKGRCVAEDPPEKALVKAMPTLLVQSVRSERVLAKVRGPVVAEKATGRKPCEAKFTITVPYRSKYRLGLVTAYRGIADPDDPPASPIVVSKGNAQNVLFIY